MLFIQFKGFCVIEESDARNFNFSATSSSTKLLPDSVKSYGGKGVFEEKLLKHIA